MSVVMIESACVIFYKGGSRGILQAHVGVEFQNSKGTNNLGQGDVGENNSHMCSLNPIQKGVVSSTGTYSYT